MASDAVGIGDILVGVELVECGPFTIQDGDRLVLEGNSQGLYLSVLQEERVPCLDAAVPAPQRYVHRGCGGTVGQMIGYGALPEHMRMYLCECGKEVRRGEVE